MPLLNAPTKPRMPAVPTLKAAKRLIAKADWKPKASISVRASCILFFVLVNAAACVLTALDVAVTLVLRPPRAVDNPRIAVVEAVIPVRVLLSCVSCVLRAATLVAAAGSILTSILTLILPSCCWMLCITGLRLVGACILSCAVNWNVLANLTYHLGFTFYL
jgi:hypothetical protein